MKKISAVIRRGLRALSSESRRDDGVIGLIIIIALLAAAAALIASSVRQNKDAEVRRLSANASSTKLLNNSAISYFFADADGAGPLTALNRQIPCPDTNFPPDGTSNGTTVCAATTGVVPWLSMGISEDEAIDAFGNYFTYVVSGVDSSRQICTSVTNSYDTTKVEYTGTLNDVTDTEARLTSQAATQGTPFYYAFISHGKNGRGAISRSGARSAPTSSQEIQNCPSNNANCTGGSADPDPLVIFTGPKNATDATIFDDTVYVASATQLTSMCEGLAPGKGTANAEVAESFTDVAAGTAALPTSLATTNTATAAVELSTVAGNTTNKVLRFTGANAAVRSAVPTFNPAEHARYVTFEWRPTSVPSTTAGISIGLRATSTDRNITTTVGTFDADIFNTVTNDGLTVRFFEDAVTNADGATLNRIYICDNVKSACDNTGGNGGAGNLASSDADTFLITLNQAYTVEAYDDGVNVWARITQVATPTNTAVVSFAAVPPAVPLDQQDLGGNNSVVVVNYSDATVELDGLVIGRGSMAVNFNTADQVISTVASSHGTGTGNLTLEAWVRPTSLPSGSTKATLLSKWIDGGAAATEGYRLYLTNGGALALELAGDDAAGGVNIVTAPTINFGGYKAAVGRWDHLAVSFSKTEQAAKLYLNRELISTISVTTFDTTAGINSGSAGFSIGAECNSGPPCNMPAAITNEFAGDITDVRVWNTSRTAAHIFANYNRRIGLITVDPDLIVNWTLDPDTGASFTTPAPTATTASSAGVAGVTTGTATYIGILQRHFPPFATPTMCAVPALQQGAVVGPYECDYRFTAQSSPIVIPDNLASLYVKAWGGGGGGYDASALLYPVSGNGGGAGFSAGRIQYINGIANPIAAALGLRVDVGGGGGGSSGSNNGAGGGGASGLWRDVDSTNTVTVGDFAGVTSGGGGGASYGDDNLGQGVDCRSSGACGPGGGGGGPFNFTSLARDQTTRAADSADNTCGGRGGDNVAFGANPPDTTDNNCESGGSDPTTTVGASGAGTAAGGASIIGAGGAGFDGTAPEIGAGGAGGGVRVSAMTSGGGEAGGYDTAGAGQAGTTDANGSGFGAGGGSGFADTGASGVVGAAGSALVPGGTTDPNYALATCTIVTCPTTTPGRGGESGSTTGKTGAVILKW